MTSVTGAIQGPLIGHGNHHHDVSPHDGHDHGQETGLDHCQDHGLHQASLASQANRSNWLPAQLRSYWQHGQPHGSGLCRTVGT